MSGSVCGPTSVQPDWHARHASYLAAVDPELRSLTLSVHAMTPAQRRRYTRWACKLSPTAAAFIKSLMRVVAA